MKVLNTVFRGCEGFRQGGVGLGGISSVHAERDIELPVSPSVKMCSSRIP